jgi:hypothetical protein
MLASIPSEIGPMVAIAFVRETSSVATCIEPALVAPIFVGENEQTPILHVKTKLLFLVIIFRFSF